METDPLVYDILELTDEQPDMSEEQIINWLIVERGISREIAEDALYSTPGYW